MVLYPGGFALLDKSPFTVLQRLEQLKQTQSTFCAFNSEKVRLFHGSVALFWGPLDVFYEFHLPLENFTASWENWQPLFQFLIVVYACQPLHLRLSLRSFPHDKHLLVFVFSSVLVQCRLHFFDNWRIVSSKCQVVGREPQMAGTKLR